MKKRLTDAGVIESPKAGVVDRTAVDAEWILPRSLTHFRKSISDPVFPDGFFAVRRMRRLPRGEFATAETDSSAESPANVNTSAEIYGRRRHMSRSSRCDDRNHKAFPQMFPPDDLAGPRYSEYIPVITVNKRVPLASLQSRKKEILLKFHPVIKTVHFFNVRIISPALKNCFRGRALYPSRGKAHNLQLSITIFHRSTGCTPPEEIRIHSENDIHRL